MIVYPAIDIRNGCCVRLLQGSFEKETVYGKDPVAMAKRLKQAGAVWIHVVDLDGARTGVGVNLPLIEQMTKLGLKIELGGGIRSEEDFIRRMECGVARCVLGTAAIENPALMAWAAKTYPGRVAVGIDAKDGRVAVKGWEEKSTLTPLEVAKNTAQAGVKTVVYTEIANDGMQNGPDIEASAALAAQSGLEVIVSGGVGIWKM
ncbi:MAG: HisA/HisF-related TIM barrel protein [Christensenellales bacterium]